MATRLPAPAPAGVPSSVARRALAARGRVVRTMCLVAVVVAAHVLSMAAGAAAQGKCMSSGGVPLTLALYKLGAGHYSKGTCVPVEAFESLPFSQRSAWE